DLFRGLDGQRAAGDDRHRLARPSRAADATRGDRAARWPRRWPHGRRGLAALLPLLGSAARARVASRRRRLRRAAGRGAGPPDQRDPTARALNASAQALVSMGLVLRHAEPVALTVLHDGLDAVELFFRRAGELHAFRLQLVV